LSTSRTPRRIAARRLVPFLAVAVALTSCGDTSHRYIANKGENVYVRIPAGWDDIAYGADEPDALEQMTSDVTLLWRSAAGPGDDAGTDAPLLTTAVYELSGTLNQRMSPTLARVAASPTGFDPVLPADDASAALVEVLDYAPLAFDQMSGTRTVFRARSAADAEWSQVFSMSTAFDLSRFRLYVMLVGCSPACFEANSDAISSAASSWLVTQ